MRSFPQFLKSGFESLLIELFVDLQPKKEKKKEEDIFIINPEYVRNQSEFIINLWMFTNKDVHTHTHTYIKAIYICVCVCVCVCVCRVGFKLHSV